MCEEKSLDKKIENFTRDEIENFDIYHPDKRVKEYEKSKPLTRRIGMLAIRYLWAKSKVGKVATLGSGCPMHPHCSKYGYLSIGEHGLLKGSMYAIARVLRCNPFYLYKLHKKQGNFHDHIKLPNQEIKKIEEKKY